MAVATPNAAELAAAAADEAIAWRRHLHRNPELAFEEVETSQFVYDTLDSFGGLELIRPTPTSVLARLAGARPGKTIALRADIDALPIAEENTFEFASRRPGAMHACGHDGHTAMMLATARILTDLRDQISGEIRFVFQHAEETPPGGAREVVAAGVLEGVDVVMGCHLMSVAPTGKICVARGSFMAAADTFSLEIEGKGGHAGMPQGAVDPIVIASEIVLALQQIVSRETSPLDSVLVSVTRINAGSADNIIPQTVELGGTVRTYKPELRTSTREAVERIATGIAHAHRATARLDYREGYTPVVNDPERADLVEGAARRALGDDAIGEPFRVMGGDDFSAYQQVVPGVYFVVGARNDEIGASFPHHHPRFTIDEAALQNGIAVFVQAVLDLTA